MIKKFLTGICISVVAMSAFAQFAELDMQPTNYQNNYPFGEGEVQVTNIPLPEGEWTVIRGNDITLQTRRDRGETSPYKMREVFISNVNNGRLNHFLYVYAQVTGISMYFNDEPCKGDNFIYKNDYGTRMWDQRCLTIQQGQVLGDQNSKPQQVARDFFAKNGIKFIPESLSVQFSQFDHIGRYLVVRLRIFPANYGLENPVISAGVSGHWTAANYKNYPNKVNFIEALKKWAENYSDVLYKSFKEGKPQNVVIPAFAWSAPQ